MFQLKHNKPGKERCWIELTDNRLDVGEARREGVHRHDVAIPY
jgi:hypothetical protein